jgi:hypothetical protein
MTMKFGCDEFEPTIKINLARALRVTSKVNALTPVPFFQTPPVSERPHSSARGGVDRSPSRATRVRTLSQSQSHRPVQTALYASVRLPAEG